MACIYPANHFFVIKQSRVVSRVRRIYLVRLPMSLVSSLTLYIWRERSDPLQTQNCGQAVWVGGALKNTKKCLVIWGSQLEIHRSSSNVPVFLCVCVCVCVRVYVCVCVFASLISHTDRTSGRQAKKEGKIIQNFWDLGLLLALRVVR